MAATRLIPLHINKGKTLAQCLSDRTDYSENGEKTNNGEYISSFECCAETADEEFLLSKRQYQHITGRRQQNDVIAYQLRQSFKPGEITPAEANQVGYETAMRFLKGKHAFIVATHIDRAHIHNHIIFNSTTLDCTHKFNNFFLSAFAIQRLSDLICLEHGLSVISPKPYKERDKRTTYPKKSSQRDSLINAISTILDTKPNTLDDFITGLEKLGYEFKDGKNPAFKHKEHKRYIRLKSLPEEYTWQNIEAVIAGKKAAQRPQRISESRQFNLLIDVQAKIVEGKGKGYERWAKKYNRKEAAKTVCLLKEKGINSYDELTALTKKLTTQFDELSDTIKNAEKRMKEISALQTHINNYSKTQKVFEDYRKSGYSRTFFETHRDALLLRKAAKQAFDLLENKKIPSRKSLNEEFYRLLSEKKAAYAEYRKIKKEKEEYLIAQNTVETILGMDRKKNQDRQQEQKAPEEQKE